MLLSALTSDFAATPTPPAPRPVLRMVPHERMGGSVPVWEIPKSARDQTIGQLAAVQSGRSFDDVLNDAMAYAPAQPASIEDAPFGFADLVDIVNPLHHIPLVGTLYREMTGDTIRDSGRIVGGALFGGPAGAAAGLANTIIAHETGSSVEGHALAMLRDPSAQKETLDRFASPNPSRLSPDLHLSFAAQPANLDPPAPARVRAVYRFND
jgi:hypothetical protein